MEDRSSPFMRSVNELRERNTRHPKPIFYPEFVFETRRLGRRSERERERESVFEIFVIEDIVRFDRFIEIGILDIVLINLRALYRNLFLHFRWPIDRF